MELLSRHQPAGNTGASELEGCVNAWRNLLWDSVRMLQAGRPDLALRFRKAASEVHRAVTAAHGMWPAHAGNMPVLAAERP